MLYQGGRKDPFTFATKSNGTWGGGLNPLKIYNAQGKEIVQALDGTTDTNGGITIVTEQASSMLETIRKPNTYYATSNNAFINQVGLTRDIWDYYWTSYSRGTDGINNPQDPNYNNIYLNGYLQKRTKSIFDPCPYGFRVPTNGTYNAVEPFSLAWMRFSCIGGIKCIIGVGIWLPVNSHRWHTDGKFANMGFSTSLLTSTISIDHANYALGLALGIVVPNQFSNNSYGMSIRCIEDAKKEVADITTTSSRTGLQLVFI